MFRNIEQKILQIQKATGIEIIILPGDKILINTTTLVLKKNKIVKEQANIGIQSISELVQKVKPGLPVSVVINGRGVLTKNLFPSVKNNTLQSVLPNANPGEFYFEEMTNEGYSVISIIRKETFDRLIDTLEREGYKIISATPGATAISNLLSFLKPEITELETDTFHIRLQKQVIQEIRTRDSIEENRFQSEEILVADQYVRPSNLLSFAAAIRALADDCKTPPPVASASIVHQRKELRFAKIFRFAGMTMLAFIFILLFINFFVYNNLLQKNQSLQASQLNDMEEQRKSKMIEKEVSRKEKFLQQYGWANSGRASFYADRIGSITPMDIELVSLNIYPSRVNTNFADDGSLFKKDTIQINGSCTDPAELNKFVNNLKILADFQHVSLKDYKYSADKDNGVFTIETITK